MLTDISHPRIGVVGLLIPRIAVLGFLYIVRFKLHFKVSMLWSVDRSVRRGRWWGLS
jgi:hypothetical protein